MGYHISLSRERKSGGREKEREERSKKRKRRQTEREERENEREGRERGRRRGERGGGRGGFFMGRPPLKGDGIFYFITVEATGKGNSSCGQMGGPL